MRSTPSCLLVLVLVLVLTTHSLLLTHWMQAMEDGASPGQVLLRCALYAAAAGGLIAITLCRNMVLPYASVRLRGCTPRGKDARAAC